MSVVPVMLETWKKELETYSESAGKLLENLKKDNTSCRKDAAYNKKKRTQLETISDKVKLVYNDIVKFNSENKVDNKILEQINVLLPEIRGKLRNANSILNDRKVLEDNKEEIDSNLENSINIDNCETKIVSENLNLKNIKMATFDFRTASSLLPKLDGKVDTVRQLIDAIELYEISLDAQSKVSLINYVIKICLTHKEKIRMQSTYRDINSLIVDLRTNFLPKQSSSFLSTQLQATKQGSLSVEKYGEKIQALMADLTITQAGENEQAKEVFGRENEKLAINIFANGVNNSELRTIIKARNYQKLSDAINAAKEEYVAGKTQEQQHIFRIQHNISNSYRSNHLRRGNFQNNRGNNRFNNNNNNNGNSNGNNSFRNSNYQQSRGRGFAPRQQNSGNYYQNNRNSFNNSRGGNSNRGRQSSRIFTATNQEGTDDNQLEFFRPFTENSRI